MNLEKLKKYHAKTKTVTVKYDGQEETFEIRQISGNESKLLSFSKDDADKPFSEILDKNYPLLAYCLDVDESQVKLLDVGFLMSLFEQVMETVMKVSTDDQERKEKLLEQVRNKGKTE